MRHLRRTVLVAIAVALLVAPVASARYPQDDPGTVVTRTNGQLLGEVWAQLYSLPIAEHPFFGGDRCLSLANKVIQAINGGPCTIEQGTALTLGWGTACSNIEPPPSFGIDEAAQRACALASDQAILSMFLTVDSGTPVDIHRRSFEVFSPQRTVQLPADNIFDVSAGPATLTAHAWAAMVRNLRPGQHTITLEVTFADDVVTIPHIINVVPR